VHGALAVLEVVEAVQQALCGAVVERPVEQGAVVMFGYEHRHRGVGP